MPNRAVSSRATMSIVSDTASRVIAAGTAASGRCVVTSATRSGWRPAPPTSIITTRGTPARRAKNSVWPEKGMPASSSALFCTGAVTSASNRPAAHASAAAPSIAMVAYALVVSGRPGSAGAASGWRQISQAPPGGANDAGSYSARCGARPIRRARCTKRSRSPTNTRRARKGTRA